MDLSLYSNGSLTIVTSATVLCAFFRASHLAITRSRDAELRELGAGRGRSKYARLVRAQSGRYLLVCQIGSFVTAVLLGFSSTTLVASHMAQRFSGLGGVWIWLAEAVGVVLLSSVVLIALQLVRAIAFASPERVLLFVARPLVLFGRAMVPVGSAINAAVNLLLRPFGLTVPCERAIAIPGQEISEIVALSTAGDGIEEGEREMIKSVFLLNDTSIREIMTPRADVISAPIDSSLEQLSTIFQEEGVSRLLIVGESLDDVRGVVHAKNLLPFIGQTSPLTSAQFDLAALLRPACVLPGSSKVDDVLKKFRGEGIHFAVVLDEHGGVDGVITVEDLLEELVGEIFDEFDSPDEESLVRRTKSGEFVIDASIAIDDFNDRFNAEIPHGEYDTLAGFVIQFLNRIPQTGEQFEALGLRLRIEEAEPHRLLKIRLLRPKRDRREAPLSNQQTPTPGTTTTAEA